jgi:AcrR family transcriptional regulator
VAERAAYHHGALAPALLDAAVAAARQGGEQAIGLNRLAESVGVSASAAYRHFPGGLSDVLVSVGDVARQGLADRIVQRMSEVPPSRSKATTARRRFRASGRAYIDYVLDEPGLFQVACRHGRSASTSGADPYGLLEGCIDDLAAAGVLPAGRRRDAALAAWAAVHGLAVLLTEGSLRRFPADRREQVIDRTLDMVEAGL